MPRTNRPRRAPSSSRSSRRRKTEPPQELDIDRILGGGARRESGADGMWNVRTVTGNDKTYICPGCLQIIPTGTQHVVAWNAEGWFGEEAALADRRHWHSSCWRARGNRRPR